jgi:excisionase family DNA binding protein
MTEADDLMTVGEAREYLGVGKQKMAKLIRDRVLPTQPDPLDQRIRLIRRANVEQLRRQSKKLGR